jgi:hypothetical protein
VTKPKSIRETAKTLDNFIVNDSDSNEDYNNSDDSSNNKNKKK